MYFFRDPKPVSCHFLLLVLVLPTDIHENKMPSLIQHLCRCLSAAFLFLILSSEHSLITNSGVHPNKHFFTILYELTFPRHSARCLGVGNEEWALCLMGGQTCGQIMTPWLHK